MVRGFPVVAPETNVSTFLRRNLVLHDFVRRGRRYVQPLHLLDNKSDFTLCTAVVASAAAWESHYEVFAQYRGERASS